MRVAEHHISGHRPGSLARLRGRHRSHPHFRCRDRRGLPTRRGCGFGGSTGGRAVMLACAQALGNVDEQADARAAFSSISSHVAGVLPEDLDLRDRPEAAMVVFSRWRREIWRIGDSGFWYAGLRPGGIRPRKLIDRHAADIRAAVTSAELAAGVGREDVARADPGRSAIQSLLRWQAVFRNNPGAGAWAYGAIDGTAVPGKFVDVVSVPEQVTEIVIASDGIPLYRPHPRAERKSPSRSLGCGPALHRCAQRNEGGGPGECQLR